MGFPGEGFGVLKCVRCIAGIIEHVEPLVAYREAVRIAGRYYGSGRLSDSRR